MPAGQKYLQKLGRWFKPLFGAVLTKQQKRIVYQFISVIRSAVDIVALRCGDAVVTYEGEDQALFDRLFCERNTLGETFRDVVFSVVVDLLTVGRGFIWVAPNQLGTPSRLYSVDAVEADEVFENSLFRGIKVHQQQIPEEELIVLRTFSGVADQKSLIDCVANEAACYLRLVERVAHYLDKRAIPPGILNVVGGSEDAIASLRSAFSQAGIKVAQDLQVEYKSLGPVVPVDPRVISDFKASVYQIYGVYFEQGRPTSWLVPIIVEDIERQLNLSLRKWLKGTVKLTVPLFVSMKDLSLLVRGGVLSPNEARSYFKLPPVKGGEVPSILAPTGLVTLPETVEEAIEEEMEKSE